MLRKKIDFGCYDDSFQCFKTIFKVTMNRLDYEEVQSSKYWFALLICAMHNF